MNHRLGLALVASALVAISVPTTAAALPILPAGTEGIRIIVSSLDPVLATFQGSSAGYSSDLYLLLDGAGNPGDDGDVTNDLFLFNNHASRVGSQLDLGSFAPGTELTFGIVVHQTGHEFLTGSAELNPDGRTHARVQRDWRAGETLVGFEDLWYGPGSWSDLDYNDLVFSFTNTSTRVAVAEPPILGWFVVGIAGIALSMRRKRSA